MPEPLGYQSPRVGPPALRAWPYGALSLLCPIVWIAGACAGIGAGGVVIFLPLGIACAIFGVTRSRRRAWQMALCVLALCVLALTVNTLMLAAAGLMAILGTLPIC